MRIDDEFVYIGDWFQTEPKYDQHTGRNVDYYTGDDQMLEEEE